MDILENVYDGYVEVKRRLEHLRDLESELTLRIEELERENAELRDERDELLKALSLYVGEDK